MPFISWLLRNVNVGTDVMAPPGAQTVTPLAPSAVGPLDDQVYGHPVIQPSVYYLQAIHSL